MTTHSYLLTREEIKELHIVLCEKLKPPKCGDCPIPSFDVYSCLLQDFGTELDFTTKIRFELQYIYMICLNCLVLANSACLCIFLFSAAFEANKDTLLIVQCDSGHLNGDLIACARYRICDKRLKTSQEQYQSNTHVLFIIHLPRRAPGSSFVGFQGEPWTCYHVDDLRALDNDHLSLHSALDMKISDLFYNREFVSEIQTEGTVDTQQFPLGSEMKHQCRRLRNCIQAAASRIHDSEENRERATKRIELLLQLIPESPPSDHPLSKFFLSMQIHSSVCSLLFTSPCLYPCCPYTDDCTFYGALVKHMLGILKQKEKEESENTNWACNEALNTKKLQHGGTFRNALARKIDEVLIPLFAEIIALIDCNYNLDLVVSNPQDSDIFKMWIRMFQNNDLCKLKYSDIAANAREHIPGAGNLLSNSNFYCHLPFSWVIRNTIRAQWSNGRSTTGKKS